MEILDGGELTNHFVMICHGILTAAFSSSFLLS